MGIKAKIIEKSKPGKPEEKYYCAVPNETGMTKYYDFVMKVSNQTQIYRRTVSLVLTTAYDLLYKEFEQGKTVQMPDMGEVHLSFESNAKKTNKGFKASDINKKRVIVKLGTQL